MNAEATPQPFHWDAEHSVMRPDYPKRADRQYVDGEHYRLGVIEERSMASHSHFFALLNEAWSNLPEKLAERYPSIEHLRKASLIATGHRTVSDYVCSSPAEALRLAGFLESIDPYAVVVINGAIVSRLVAKSQSRSSMSKAEFQQSKSDVLAFVADLVGTSVDELSKARSA